MASIFVNYRGRDSAWAVLLDHELSARFGAEAVFLASRSIRPADDFVSGILAAVRGCSVLLAVVGEGWATVPGADGTPRLADPSDWVRREIREALDGRIPVLPVLIGEATPVAAAELPVELRGLAQRQYLRLQRRSVATDIDRIAAEVVRLAPELLPPGGLRRTRPGGRRRTARPGRCRAVAALVGAGAIGVGVALGAAALPAARTPDPSQADPRSGSGIGSGSAAVLPTVGPTAGDVSVPRPGASSSRSAPTSANPPRPGRSTAAGPVVGGGPGLAVGVGPTIDVVPLPTRSGAGAAPTEPAPVPAPTFRSPHPSTPRQPAPPVAPAVSSGFGSPAAGASVARSELVASGTVASAGGTVLCVVRDESGNYWPYTATVGADSGWSATVGLGPSAIKRPLPFTLILATATDAAVTAIDRRYGSDGVGPTLPAGVVPLARVSISRQP